MAPTKLIDLSSLGGTIATVQLTEGGEARALLPPSAGIARKVRDLKLAGSPADDLTEGLALLAELMPSATPAEISGLTAAQIGVLLKIVSKHLEIASQYADQQLAALFPNGAGPTTSASA